MASVPRKLASAPLGPHEREEFVACLLVVAERSKHGAGDGLAELLFHAAHLHAKMARLDNDPDALRREVFFDGVRDLARHAFLSLKPPREHFQEARDFAEPQNFLVRQIVDMRFSENR